MNYCKYNKKDDNFFCKTGLTYVSFFTAKEMVVRLCNWESLNDMRPDLTTEPNVFERVQHGFGGMWDVAQNLGGCRIQEII